MDTAFLDPFRAQSVPIMQRLGSEELKSSSQDISGGSSFSTSCSTTQLRSARSSLERSPQKSISESRRDSETKISKAHEFITRLHTEERIRDATSLMLADLNYGQSHQHKPHGNVLKQLNSLNLIKTESQHKKKVKAHFDAADKEVEAIQEQLRHLGIDEDDFSSGDEDGISGGPSILFGDEYNFDEDDVRTPTLAHLPGILSSAASSTMDLSSLAQPNSHLLETDVLGSGSQSSGQSMPPETAMRHTLHILEALNPQSNDAPTAVDRISELILTVPSVAAELRTKAPWPEATTCIRPFILETDALRLGLGFRLLRLLTVDLSAFRYFNEHLLLEILLAHVLAKDDQDQNHQLRLHATQLIRAIVNLPGGPEELSLGTYRALIAVGEQSCDDIRYICVETLAELMVMNPGKVFEAGGVKVMLNAMNEPEDESKNPTSADEKCAFALAVAIAFTDAADCPILRHLYLRDGRDLSAVLIHFTDAPLYGFIKLNKSKLQSSAIVMQTLLRSWVGLCCFDLRLLVQCMMVPVSEIQDTLLSVLDGILWLPTSSEHAFQQESSARNAEMLSHQFTAVLLRQLQRWGLQEKLVLLQTEGATDQVRKKAQYLGSKIFILSSKLVPQHAVVDSSMVIPDKLSAQMSKAPPHSLPTACAALFGSEAELQKSVSWKADPDLSTFIRFGLSMDDLSFKRLVAMTHVLDTKLFRQWNWDALMELVQGPLRSPKRLEELTRGSKFLKRLLSFYRPFKYRFSNLTIKREHLHYVEVGKELMQSLLETSEGARYLSQNKLFRQIAECLAQLDPLSGIMSNEPLFSVRRFRSTLCGAYSELIGVLSRSVVGQQILAQIRIFNMFYRVCDISREDVIRSIICALEYRMEGHPRLILAKALSSSSKSIRLYATEFVGSQLASSDPYMWAVDLMIEQLYDAEHSVASAAVHSLYEMCAASGHVLDYLISTKPFLGHVSEAAEPLRILFMSQPLGFELLLSEFESSEVEQWAPEFNILYVEKVETYLESLNFSSLAQQWPSNGAEPNASLNIEPFKFPTYSRPSKRHHQGLKNSPPAHFYGELGLTDRGCRFLKSKGAIVDLGKTIEDAALNPRKEWIPEDMLRIKSALWACGHIASRQKGALLLDLVITENICTICKNAEIFSLRGTAFYCLGLFALSHSGAELLHQCGWDVVYDVYSQPIGVALPPETYYSEINNEFEIRKNRNSNMIFPPKSPDEESISGTSSIGRRSPKDDSRNPFESEGAKPDSNDSAIFPVTHSGKPGETVMKSKISVRSAQFGSQKNLARRLRTSFLGNEGNKPAALIAPPISFFPLHPSNDEGAQFDFENDNNSANQNTSCFDLIEPKTDTTVELLLRSISQLGSYVLAQTASRALVTMRASHQELFKNGAVLEQVAEILATGHYKQVTRRFIFELFDMKQCFESLYRRSRSI